MQISDNQDFHRVHAGEIEMEKFSSLPLLKEFTVLFGFLNPIEHLLWHEDQARSNTLRPQTAESRDSAAAAC
jgi:hypothetical protein